MFYIYYFFIYLLPLLDVSGEESLTHCGYMGRWESGFLRETESCWMPVCVSEHTDTHNEKEGWVGEKQRALGGCFLWRLSEEMQSEFNSKI